MPNKEHMQINFDSEWLKKIPRLAGELAFSKFAISVEKEAQNYLPVDTGSLADSFYIDDFKNHYVCGYGSRTLNDPMNEIVIYQHETPLNHYGVPGQSMRLGVPGATIPGNKRFNKQTGESIDGFSDPKHDEDYQTGYEQKKAAGELQKYSSQFLKRALEVVAGRPIKELTSEINLEILYHKNAHVKLPPGVL